SPGRPRPRGGRPHRLRPAGRRGAHRRGPSRPPSRSGRASGGRSAPSVRSTARWLADRARARPLSPSPAVRAAVARDPAAATPGRLLHAARGRSSVPLYSAGSCPGFLIRELPAALLSSITVPLVTVLAP